MRGLSMYSARRKLQTISEASKLSIRKYSPSDLRGYLANSCERTQECAVDHGPLEKSQISFMMDMCTKRLTHVHNYLGKIFAYYTAHSPDHANRVFRLILNLAEPVVPKLRGYEFQLLMLLPFVHDIGLTMIRSEQRQAEKLIRLSSIRGSKSRQKYRSKLNALEETMRNDHHLRVGEYFLRQNSGEFIFAEQPEFKTRKMEGFLRDLIVVSKSHRFDSPLPTVESVWNIALLSALLKLADECDVSVERMPGDRQLVKKLFGKNPKNLDPYSREGLKHLLRPLRIKEVCFDHIRGSIVLRVIEAEQAAKESGFADMHELNKVFLADDSRTIEVVKAKIEAQLGKVKPVLHKNGINIHDVVLL